MNHKIALSALIVFAGAATAGGLAFAKSANEENDALAELAKAKITLVQAVAAAEAHGTGKATKAELDGERGVLVFEVEVVTAENKVLDIKIDAADGKVLSSREDKSDRGEKEDKDD